MSAVEQEIIEKVRRLDEETQKRVLAFIEELEIPPDTFARTYTARDLMNMPPEERSRIMTEAFNQAAEEDFEIFEAYSEEDFDESP